MTTKPVTDVRIVTFTEEMIAPVVAAVEEYLHAVHGEWDVNQLAAQVVAAHEGAAIARAAHAADRHNTAHPVAMSRHESYGASCIVHLLTAKRCTLFLDRLDYSLTREIGREVGVRRGFIEVLVDELATLGTVIEELRSEFLSHSDYRFGFGAHSESDTPLPRDVLVAQIAAILV